MEQKEKPILQIEDMSVSFTRYGRGLRQSVIETIHRMNLAVFGGELVAVVGASGSGKSLLAQAVMGILPYNAKAEGEIRYQGEKLTQEKILSLRGNEIVMIPQSTGCLDPLQKIGTQIRKGRKDRESRERLRNIFRRYELSEEVEELYPFQLSGGMNRRVLIAMALMEEAKLLIADEPTPGLDSKLAGRVMEDFRKLADAGVGVLVITHDLELALRAADRIVIFHEGCTVEAVRPSDFETEDGFKHSFTKALWRAMRKVESGEAGGLEY